MSLGCKVSNKVGDNRGTCPCVDNTDTRDAALGDKYGLSITIPSSYWYMRHFDIVNLIKTVDWFNVMSCEYPFYPVIDCHDSRHVLTIF